MSAWVIALPVWGQWYVDICVRYTIPALRIALDRAGLRPDDIAFKVHTDGREQIAAALEGYQVEFLKVPPHPKPFHAFAQAHRDVIASAPAGSVLMMLNADIVVSEESVSFARAQFAQGKKAIAAVAMRCDALAPDIPIGKPAGEMLEWFWANRHPIATDCLWGTGRTMLPTNLFFEDGDSVVLHCFHLYPIMLKKDRDLKFGVTIDDDLLQVFAPEEWAVVANRQAAFLELSPPTKAFRSGEPLSVKGILSLGRSFSPHHVSLFRHAIRIRGEGEVPASQPIVDAVAEGYTALWAMRPQQRHVRQGGVRR